MKKSFLIFIISLIIISCNANNPLSPTSPETDTIALGINVNTEFKFGNLLIELETSIKWNSQTSDWRSRRNAWILELRQAATITAMRDLLLEFERKINWTAQSSNWKNKRSTWVSQVRNAGSQAKLAKPLLDLEKSIKYSSQISSWKSKRSDWILRVKAL